jgi:prepilin-type N-terminal cleavage/methylation domain-containing protein
MGDPLMKLTRGFTLIELAVVLAIIAVLAAILTPIVTSYIDQARDVRGRSDVGAISRAVLLYQRDTGRFPIYSSFANANADTPAADLLVTGGSAPVTAGAPDWTGVATAADLSDYLNVNKLSAGIGTGSSGNQNLGVVAFRGPYLDSAIQSDPWGNRYTVTARHLRRTAQGSWAFVISAGPDSTISTDFDQLKTGAFVVSGDDLVSVVR